MKDVLSKLPDQEVSLVSDALVKTDADRRFDIGLMSLWGYPSDYVTTISHSGRLLVLARALTDAKLALDQEFMDYLIREIQQRIYTRVTEPSKASPFVVRGAAPYVWGRVSPVVITKLSGKWMVDRHKTAYPSDVISVRKRILALGKAFLSNDYSGLQGEVSKVQKAVEGIKREFEGLTSEDEMESIFDREWPEIQPILDTIAGEVISMIPDPSMVIIGGPHRLDSEAAVWNVLKTLRDRGLFDVPKTTSQPSALGDA
jgi:hypothetical protein